MMVSCQVSVLQLVSCHVIENSKDRFKRISYGPPASQRVVSLHQILAGNVITIYMLGTTTKLLMLFQVYSS